MTIQLNIDNINSCISLRTAFVCSFAVSALKCYMCGSVTSNQDCNKNSQDCQAPLDTCMTTVGTKGEHMPSTLPQITVVHTLKVHENESKIRHSQNMLPNFFYPRSVIYNTSGFYGSKYMQFVAAANKNSKMKF